MEPVKNNSIARLIEELSSTSSTSENDDQWLLEDIWQRILLFLDTKGIRNFSLISRKICIVTLGSSHYVWYVHSKPKLCTVLTRLTLSVNDRFCSTFSVINNCIKTLLKSGYTNTAKKMALRSTLDCDNIKLVTDTIVRYQVQQGNIDEAKRTLVEAKDKVLSILNKETKDLLLLNIVKVMAQLGDIDNAIMTIQQIYFKYYQAKARMYVAQNQAQIGNTDSAIETMEQSIAEIASLEYEYSQNRAVLREIDVFLLKMCGIQNINKVAQDISKKYNRNNILLRLQIEELVQNNRKDEAKEHLIKEREALFYSNSTKKIDDLKNIAAIQFEIGDNENVKDTVEKVKDRVLESRVGNGTVRELIRIARKQVQYGDIEGAKNTLKKAAKTIKQTQVELYVFNDIIRFLVELNDSEAAESSLVWISKKHKGIIVSNYNKANALNDIATLQIKKGDKEKAMNTLKKAKSTAFLISDSYFKIKALMRIAQTILKYGDFEGMQDLLDEVGASMKLIKDTYHKTRSFIRITELQLQIGAIEDANALFLKIDKLALCIQKQYRSDQDVKQYRDRVFSALFKVRLQSGSVDNAMKAFRAIRHAHIKINALLQTMHIVERQIEDNGHAVFSSFLERILGTESFREDGLKVV